MTDSLTEYGRSSAAMKHQFIAGLRALYEGRADGATPSNLNAGIIGYTFDIMANAIEDSYYEMNSKAKEIFPSVAKNRDSVYMHAISNNIPSTNFFAQPASIDIIIGIKESDIFKKAIEANTTAGAGYSELVLSDKTQVLLGDYVYKFDYPVQIIVKSTTKGKIISAKYRIPLEKDLKNEFSRIQSNYIIGNTQDLNGVTYYVFNVKCHQVILSTQEYIHTSTTNEVDSYTVNFDSQLAGFDVWYRKTDNEPWKKLDKKYLGTLAANYKAMYCYYRLLDDNQIEISFPNDPEAKVPEYGSKLKIDVYTTSGNQANFKFSNGTNDISLNFQQDKDNMYENAFSGINPVVQLLSQASVDGKNALTIDELRDKIIDMKSSRSFIISQDDMIRKMEMYGMKIVKQRDDIFNREFLTYNLLQDKESKYIVPSRNGELYLPKNHLVNANDVDALFVEPESIFQLWTSDDTVSYNTYRWWRKQNTSDSDGVYYSFNGVDWYNSSLKGVAVNNVVQMNSVFVASSSSGNGFYYSYDGVNWNPSNIIDGKYNSLIAGNNTFLAGSGENKGIYYSANGAIWNRSSLITGNVNTFFINNTFYLAAGPDCIWYSTDRLTWLISNVKTNAGVNNIVYNVFSRSFDGIPYIAEIYVASSDNNIWFSRDGMHWEKKYLVDELTKVKVNTVVLINDTFYAATDQGIFKSSVPEDVTVDNYFCGEEWVKVSGSPDEPIIKIVDTPIVYTDKFDEMHSVLVCISETGVWYADNDFDTWVKNPSGVTSGKFNDIKLVNLINSDYTGSFFLASCSDTSNGAIYSYNGIEWRPIHKTGVISNSIAFSSSVVILGSPGTGKIVKSATQALKEKDWSALYNEYNNYNNLLCMCPFLLKIFKNPYIVGVFDCYCNKLLTTIFEYSDNNSPEKFAVTGVKVERNGPTDNSYTLSCSVAVSEDMWERFKLSDGNTFPIRVKCEIFSPNGESYGYFDLNTMQADLVEENIIHFSQEIYTDNILNDNSIRILNTVNNQQLNYFMPTNDEIYTPNQIYPQSYFIPFESKIKIHIAYQSDLNSTAYSQVLTKNEKDGGYSVVDTFVTNDKFRFVRDISNIFGVILEVQKSTEGVWPTYEENIPKLYDETVYEVDQNGKPTYYDEDVYMTGVDGEILRYTDTIEGIHNAGDPIVKYHKGDPKVLHSPGDPVIINGNQVYLHRKGEDIISYDSDGNPKYAVDPGYTFIMQNVPLISITGMLSTEYRDIIYKQLQETEDKLTENILPMLIENNSVRIGLYNTFGPSNNYKQGSKTTFSNLENLDISVEFNVKLNNTDNADALKTSIEYTIEEYILSVMNNGYFYAHDLCQYIQDLYSSDIVYIEYGGLQVKNNQTNEYEYNPEIQTVVSSEVSSNDPHYNPEYISIKYAMDKAKFEEDGIVALSPNISVNIV